VPRVLTDGLYEDLVTRELEGALAELQPVHQRMLDAVDERPPLHRLHRVVVLPVRATGSG
jgi:hypothetical protein